MRLTPPSRRASAVVLGSILFAACSPQEKSVRVAVAVPLSGPLAASGQGIVRAVRMAVDEANKAKTLPFTLDVRTFDDKGDHDEAAQTAGRAAADLDVAVVIGHYNSGCSLPAAQVYANAGLAMITPSATNPEVTLQQTRPGWPGARNVFRVVPTDDLQGRVAATFARGRLHLRRIAVLYAKSPYGLGLAEEFRKSFTSQGGAIASFDGLAPGDQDFTALLGHIKREGLDGLYFAGDYSQAGLVMRQARDAGVKGPILSGDGAMTASLFDAAGPAADGVYLTMIGAPVESLPAGKDFVAEYKRRYPEPDQDLQQFDVFAYEAARVAIEAMSRGGYQRGKVIAELGKTSHDGPLGHTSFDDKGDTLNRVVTVTRADFKNRTFPTAP